MDKIIGLMILIITLISNTLEINKNIDEQEKIHDIASKIADTANNAYSESKDIEINNKENKDKEENVNSTSLYNEIINLKEIDLALYELTYTGNDYGVVIIEKGDRQHKYIFYGNDTIIISLTEGVGNYKVLSYSVKHDKNGNEEITCTGEELELNCTTDGMKKVFTYSTSTVEYTNIKNLLINLMNDYKTPDDLYKFFCTFEYNDELANQISKGYINNYSTNVPNTISVKKGICLDLATAMAAVLRANGYQAQLVYGYLNGYQYHSWVRVLIDEAWIDFDPTLSRTSYDFDFSSYRITEIH